MQPALAFSNDGPQRGRHTVCQLFSFFETYSTKDIADGGGRFKRTHSQRSRVEAGSPHFVLRSHLGSLEIRSGSEAAIHRLCIEFSYSMDRSLQVFKISQFSKGKHGSCESLFPAHTERQSHVGTLGLVRNEDIAHGFPRFDICTATLDHFLVLSDLSNHQSIRNFTPDFENIHVSAWTLGEDRARTCIFLIIFSRPQSSPT